jgi:hypothetical protein
MLCYAVLCCAKAATDFESVGIGIELYFAQIFSLALVFFLMGAPRDPNSCSHVTSCMA